MGCDGYFPQSDDQEPDGICSECGQPTLDGVAIEEGCVYSRPCDECGYQECDQSC